MVTYNRHVRIEDTPSPVREGLDRAICRAVERDERILAVLEDMGFPALLWMRDNYPERIIECGIAEQNGAVVAAGLAAEGYVPIINNFFFAGVARAYNQIRQSILVDRFNVKFIGREGAWGEPGISHNTIEGIGSARVMPNLVILNPSDAVEMEKAAEAMLQYVGPVLLRQESSPPSIKIFDEDLPFTIGKAFSLREGTDATIVATGYMLTEAIRALEILEREGLDVGLLDMCTLKPLDDEAIVAAARRSGAIVTAENGTTIGGLGDAVAAVLAEEWPTPLVKVGIHDEFSHSGLIVDGRDELKEHFALGAEDVATAVRAAIAKKEAMVRRA